jgi:amidase
MIERPSKEDIARLARATGWFDLTEADVDDYTQLSDLVLGVIDDVESDLRTATSTPSTAQRDAGRTPKGDEDPLHAVVRWCSVRDSGAEGPLSGKRLALKDSLAIAGVPMTLGSGVIDFVPTVDSVVAGRLLAAGAEIVAIANMDSFAFSGGADTSFGGPIGNPFDVSRSAGGSSGGSGAALYYTGSIDGAIGCDQGGSIRLPAAWCGVLGLKPTHGLVPYTAIAGIDQTFDHVGPMARTVDDLAGLLSVIAGADPSDPRQATTPEWNASACLEAVRSAKSDLTGLRIGLLAEGFSTDTPERAATSQAVRDAATQMSGAGAEIVEVSVPAHLQAGGIAFAGFVEGMAALMYGGGNGFHWKGTYWPEFAVALTEGLRDRGNALPPQIKLVALLGEHLRETYGGAIYAAAQNRRPALVAAFDAALDGFDALFLPTAPYAAFAHDASLSTVDHVMRGWEPLGNCAPTDMSGHPALSMPVASVDGMPVGGMLVGRRWDDVGLVSIAARYERAIGWDPTIVARQSQPMGPASPPVS